MRADGGLLAASPIMGTVSMLEMAGHALQVEAFARRFYTLFNARRFDEAERMVDAEALFAYPVARERLIGRAGYREIVRRWTDAFPDARVSIVAVHVYGETALTELIMEGMHVGTLQLPGLPVLPPTKRQAHLPMREALIVRNNLITSVRLEFDPIELCRTLGHRRVVRRHATRH
jgi:predicted ester cyclase